MREREIEIAKRFGVLERMENFECELLKIKGVSEVEFDLNNLFDGLSEIILIPKYYIPVSAPDYYEQRRAQLRKILDVCERFDLHETGDRIEDYGEHWYIVRHCGESWKV